MPASRAALRIMALVSGDCPQQAQRSFLPAGRTQRSSSQRVASSEHPQHSKRASVRAQRASPSACLRCFREQNGMERRRGRTASGERRWSRMICGSVPVASPCGMECSELKSRSHAPCARTVCAVRRGRARRPSLAGTRSVAGATDATNGTVCRRPRAAVAKCRRQLASVVSQGASTRAPETKHSRAHRTLAQ